MSIGITAIGAYIPYYYMKRDTIGKAWEGRGQKGERSLANVDEDSITMGVEAAMDCFRFVGREQIDALYFASTTAPYAEKASSSLIAVACDLGHDVFASDFAHCTKAGTSALKSAYDAVAANPKQQVLVTAADKRDAYPKSPQEQTLGDAAAALVVGSDNVVATIDYFTSVNNEIVDIWRNYGEKLLNVGEDRFITDMGYMASMVKVIKKTLKETGLQQGDISKVVLTTPGLSQANKVIKKTGFAEEQLQDTLMLQIGDCGTAQPLLGLIGALESAKPGDKILLAAYGNGANAFVFTVTEEVERLQTMATLQRFLSRRKEFTSYSRFLSFRGIADAQPGAPFRLPASAAMTWREQDLNLRLYASRCKCGATIFPVNRVCYACGAKDEYEAFRASDRVTKVFTYSVDRLAGRSDDPMLVQTVTEDEEGTRYYTIMTDFNPEDAAIGMEVEFTFRKMHTLGNFSNYFWKFRPIRRERI